MIRKHLILVSATLIVGGCVGSTPKESPKDITDEKPVISERCLVANPTDVSMLLVTKPGSTSNSSKSLLTSFVVTTPTPGYKFALRLSEVKESSPEQVILDLMVARPSGIVPQVLTKTKVSIIPNRFPGSVGSSVQVNCNGKPFFKVNKVLADR